MARFEKGKDDPVAKKHIAPARDIQDKKAEMRKLGEGDWI